MIDLKMIGSIPPPSPPNSLFSPVFGGGGLENPTKHISYNRLQSVKNIHKFLIIIELSKDQSLSI